MGGSPYLVFAGLAVVVVLSPGADTVLVFRMSRMHGVRTGVKTALGVVTGPVLWGLLSGMGLALVMAHNTTVYKALALCGGLYLLYLAVGCFRSMRGPATAMFDDPQGGAAEGLKRNPYVTGLLTNLLNPKIGVFYLSIMPSLFDGRRLDLWIGGSLGLIQSCIGFAFLSAVALLAEMLRPYLAGRVPNLVAELLAGLSLAGFAGYTFWTVLVR
ncbi:LysE family translocator [Kitasatospora sp. NPDC093806]|uniref:LysE family translocator n=1 Tax=Kitasatospora sp. NPDC093806 TaxID=3155075 RepID=UPI003440B744